MSYSQRDAHLAGGQEEAVRVFELGQCSHGRHRGSKKQGEQPPRLPRHADLQQKWVVSSSLFKCVSGDGYSTTCRTLHAATNLRFWIFVILGGTTVCLSNHGGYDTYGRLLENMHHQKCDVWCLGKLKMQRWQ